jgi:hypothetical protein
MLRLKPLPGFTEYQLQPPLAFEMELLATRVCAAIANNLQCSDYEPARRKVQLVRKGQAAEMAQNRLLLSFLCLTAVRRHIHRRLDSFATRPATLIVDCISALVWWNQEKGLKAWRSNLLASDVAQVLAPRALESFEDGSGLIKDTNVGQLPSQDRQDFDQTLDFLTRARFIEKYDSHNWAFTLPTFREYFAALAIAANEDPFAKLRAHLHNPEWQEVIAYTAGSLAGLAY